MQNLGHTRSSRGADHLLLTPDTFVRRGSPECIMRLRSFTSPQPQELLSRSTLPETEEGGHLGEAQGQRFVYVLEGELEVAHLSLSTDQFAYLPEGAEVVVRSRRRARVAVIEKEYQQLSGIESPDMVAGNERVYRLHLCSGTPRFKSGRCFRMIQSLILC